MAYSKGVVAYALYLEMRKDGKTHQQIWLPPMADETNKELVTPRMVGRLVSEANPRRKWKYRPVETPLVGFNSSTATIDKFSDLEEAYDAITPLLEVVEHHVSNAVRTEWTWTGTPLIVEVTKNDLEAARVLGTPTALIRRINDARKDAGYPTALWDEGTSGVDTAEF